MKTKRLRLKKETITLLSNEEMKELHGATNVYCLKTYPIDCRSVDTRGNECCDGNVDTTA